MRGKPQARNLYFWVHGDDWRWTRCAYLHSLILDYDSWTVKWLFRNVSESLKLYLWNKSIGGQNIAFEKWWGHVCLTVRIMLLLIRIDLMWISITRDYTDYWNYFVLCWKLIETTETKNKKKVHWLAVNLIHKDSAWWLEQANYVFSCTAL